MNHPRKLHFRPEDGYVGDVHPFFHNGRYYMFYLKPPLEPHRSGIAGMVSALAISQDLYNWKEYPVSLQLRPGSDRARLADALGDWWLISIARSRESGRFFAFYPRGSGICAAVSDNLLEWYPIDQNPVLPPKLDLYREWRDPFVFYNIRERAYWMLLTTSIRGEPEFGGGAISYATSTDLIHWHFKGTIFRPGNVGSPECPEMFMIGDQWYLIASLLTPRGVGKTSYWSSDNPTGPWRAYVPDSLDGWDLCAGNTVYDGKRRLLFGWVPTYGGSEEARGQQWGGHLALPREIYRLPDGSLATRLPDDLWRLIRGTRAFPNDSRKTFLEQEGRWRASADGISNLSQPATFALPVDAAQAALEVQITVGRNQEAVAGITIMTPQREPAFNAVVNWKECSLSVKRARPGGITFNSLPLARPLPQTITMRLILEEDILEVFLDQRYSLVTRLPEKLARFVFGGFVQNGTVRFHNSLMYSIA
ncbi:MAG: hypothetical protein RMM08_11095 [Armatimonadota bacterium]|nr:hypothetical protein [bacterium]MDW8321896.1 hypothetical protein [Armatimonadota bacterium]